MTSKSKSMPQPASPPSSSSRAINLDPSSSVNILDLPYELTSNPDNYRGEEWFTIFSMPGYIRTSLDRLRASLPPRSKPGVGVIASCCIQSGLNAFKARSEVGRFSALRSRVDMVNRYSNQFLVDLTIRFMDSFSVDPFPVDLSGKTQFNFQMPEEIRISLGNMAKSLGVTSSVLAALLIGDSLSNPESFGDMDEMSTIAGHEEKMREAVENFLYFLGLRCANVESMLERIQKEKEKTKMVSKPKPKPARRRRKA